MAWPFKAGLTLNGPTPFSAGARRDEESFSRGKVPKINPVVGQFRLTLRPQEGGVTARQLRNASFSAAHPQEKKKQNCKFSSLWETETRAAVSRQWETPAPPVGVWE